MSDLKAEVQVVGKVPPPEVMVIAVAGLLSDLLRRVHASEVAACLHAALGKAMADLPDSFFAEAVDLSAKPCGNPGCDCEKRRRALMGMMEAVRARTRAIADEARGEQSFPG